MEQITIAAASYEKQKYFLSEDFLELPKDIKEEIQILMVLTAQKLHTTFLMQITSMGEVSFEIVRGLDDFLFDEIGAELEMKEILKTKKELLKALKLWYLVFATEEGKKLRDELKEE